MSTRQHLWTPGDCLACMCHPFWTQILWWRELQPTTCRWSIARSAACWSVPNSWIKMHFSQKRRKILFSFDLLQPSMSGSCGFISAVIFMPVQSTNWFTTLPESLFRSGRSWETKVAMNVGAERSLLSVSRSCPLNFTPELSPKPTHPPGHASTCATHRPEDLCTHDTARTSGGSSRALHARRCVKCSWWVRSLPEKDCSVSVVQFCLTMITTHKEAFSYHLVPAFCLPICKSQCHFSAPNSNFVLSRFFAPFRCHA